MTFPPTFSGFRTVNGASPPPNATIKLPDGTQVSLIIDAVTSAAMRDWVDDRNYSIYITPWIHERWAVRAAVEIVWEAARRCFVSGTARHNVSVVLHNLRCWATDLHSRHLRVAARHARRLDGNTIFNATKILAQGMRERGYQVVGAGPTEILRVCGYAINTITFGVETAEMLPRIPAIVDEHRILDLSDGRKLENMDARWAALALLEVGALADARRLVKDYLDEGGK